MGTDRDTSVKKYSLKDSLSNDLEIRDFSLNNITRARRNG